MDENENFDEFIDTIEDLNHEGDQLIENNDLTGAKAKYEKSFSLIQEISKFTDNANSQWLLVDCLSIDCLSRLGYVLLKIGDITGGKKHYNVLLEVLRRLIAIEPNNINWLEAYYSSLRKIADVLHEQGRDENLLIAIGYYEEAIKTLEHLIELELNEHEWYRCKSKCYNELGDTYLSYGDRNTSERCYKESL